MEVCVAVELEKTFFVVFFDEFSNRPESSALLVHSAVVCF